MEPRAFFLCYTLLSMLQQFREKGKNAEDVFEDFSFQDWMKTQTKKAADCENAFQFNSFPYIKLEY